MPDICVWNKCNNRCVMCTNPLEFSQGGGYSASRVIANLKKLKSLKIKDASRNYFLLTGGEPTLNPELFSILEYLKKNFSQSRLGILSNGRMFAYEGFAKKIFKFGDFDLALPLHGFDAKTHDAVTRTPGSFKNLMSGIENVRRFRNGHNLEIRVILTNLTNQNLEKITKFAAENLSWADRLVYIFMEFEGQAEDNLKIAGLEYSRIKNLSKIVKMAGEKFKDVRLYHFPLCAAPVSVWKNVWRTLPSEEVAFAEKCGVCRVKNLCLGVHRNYLKIFGEKEFKPVKRPPKLALNKNNYYHPILL